MCCIYIRAIEADLHAPFNHSQGPEIYKRETNWNEKACIYSFTTGNELLFGEKSQKTMSERTKMSTFGLSQERLKTFFLERLKTFFFDMAVPYDSYVVKDKV